MAIQKFHVGIVGAGIGGVAAAIALRRAGVEVTLLEAAEKLGEVTMIQIGAGIQITPNVSVLLQRWGVDEVIGDNLVQIEELNMRRKDGTKVGYTKIPTIEKTLGRPWWLVHRAHLHDGLVAVAERLGAVIHIDSRIIEIEYDSDDKVTAKTHKGVSYRFDLCIGADGVNSVVRSTLFPDVQPECPTTNCAYRAIVPYERIRQDPVAKELVDKLTMEVWMAPNAYVISYPISGGDVFNMVLSHHPPKKLRATIHDVPISELRDEYKDFDPRIKRIIDMVPQTTWQSRWPLLVTGPLESWSSPKKNVVLMGDAAHSMVNHMAQGAATAMEDGAFLGKCIGAVAQGKIALREAIQLYETERMPKAYMKQQVSFINGAIWHLPDGPLSQQRDMSMSAELEGKYYIRSSNLYGDPQTVLEVYGYDAEAHADEALGRVFNGGKEAAHPDTGIQASVENKYMGWFTDQPAQQKRATL
ncbi:salicylate hydroxylase [Trichoderma harzianum]|uniref:Salicylate hydroxylase n=1 Tax=Trichoderma harzianum TaxID=5544 RepID=A0A0F9XFZ0_TRIHA|nr:salicylate hydroxylase [Trichoderma harzianum]